MINNKLFKNVYVLVMFVVFTVVVLHRNSAGVISSHDDPVFITGAVTEVSSEPLTEVYHVVRIQNENTDMNLLVDVDKGVYPGVEVTVKCDPGSNRKDSIESCFLTSISDLPMYGYANGE